MATYKCPVCGGVIQVDREKKERKIQFDGKFPKHADCELAKALSNIDFTKLEEI